MIQTAIRKRKAHCNECMGLKNHLILHVEERKWSDETDPISGGDTYSLLQCAGCDQVRMLHEHWFSEDYDEDGDVIIHENYYPPALARPTPRWLNDPTGPFFFGDSEKEKLLKEIYSSLQNDSPRLAALGIRALLEIVMIEQVGDNGSITANVERFLSEGYVAPKNHDTFRTQMIEIGHAAMHRGHFPKTADLYVIMQMTESLLDALYVQPEKAKKLGQIPPRSARK